MDVKKMVEEISKSKEAQREMLASYTYQQYKRDVYFNYYIETKN